MHRFGADGRWLFGDCIPRAPARAPLPPPADMFSGIRLWNAFLALAHKSEFHHPRDFYLWLSGAPLNIFGGNEDWTRSILFSSLCESEWSWLRLEVDCWSSWGGHLGSHHVFCHANELSQKTVSATFLVLQDFLRGLKRRKQTQQNRILECVAKGKIERTELKWHWGSQHRWLCRLFGSVGIGLRS